MTQRSFSMRSGLVTLAAFMLVACGDGERADRVGQDLSTLELSLYSDTMGIFPDESVLRDPNNPFASAPLGKAANGTDMKWAIDGQTGPIVAFYAWATMLAYQPTGEHQYYAAQRLKDIFEQQLVDNTRLDTVLQMAIRAHQAVLDSFPNSVSWNATGTFSFRLAPLAFDAIVELGAEPEGNWVVVATPYGGTTVVPGSGEP